MMLPLLQHLEYTVDAPLVVLFDNDKFEEHNGARQFLARNADNIGKNKAQVLADYYTPLYKGKIETEEGWFYRGRGRGFDLIIVCADNHGARYAALQDGEQYGIPVVSGANETKSGEAWVFSPEFSTKRQHPLFRYPEIAELADASDNPVVASSGCASDEAISDNPQLPLGNAMTAAMMLTVIADVLERPSPPEYAVSQASFGSGFLRTETHKDFTKRTRA